MQTSDITDPIFLQAVEAIDSGDMALLERLVTDNPRLVTERLPTTGESYFKDPYLFWFVADNPIRNQQLPANIVDMVNFLAAEVKAKTPGTAQHQLDYCLGLVATGRIPRECGVQIAMMDALINAGAQPGGAMGALAHGNTEAANYLIERGGKLTLAVAIGLQRKPDFARLLQSATADEKLTALAAAASYGKADMVEYLLTNGAKPNGYPSQDSGFHSHATPLHQAVWSGSLATVKLLVDAGADLTATDKAYSGTPLGWAEYAPTAGGDEETLKKYAEIAVYIKSV